GLEIGPLGTVGMGRWTPGVTSVEVIRLGSKDSPDYLDFDAEAEGVQRRAIAEMNAANGGLVKYGEPHPGSGDAPPAVAVYLRLFPTSHSCPPYYGAWAVTEFEPPSAFITFCERAASHSLSASVHELGHTWGLQHSDDRRDAMWLYAKEEH